MVVTPFPLRLVAGLLVALACVVVLPLAVLSFYNHPSPADDYCFANTAMQYGFWRAQQFYYDGWSGRFFHNFLVHSSPLTIGWYGGYKVYPLVLLAGLGLAFYALASQWLTPGRTEGVTTHPGQNKESDLSQLSKLAVAAGLLVGFMATLAGLPEFLYWYAGMACYSLSAVFFLFLLATLLAHQRRGFGIRADYLLLESVLITGMVGSSETSMVMVMSVLAMVAFGEFVQRGRLSGAIVVLLGVGAVACYFLMAAPGNAIRIGSNPNSSNPSLTLLSSVRYAAGYVVHLLGRTPLLPVSLLYLPVAYRLTNGSRPAYLRVHPLLALLHGAVTVLVLISLHFYGVGIPPVPRLINLINLFVWLSWGYNLTLWVVALRGRVRFERWLPIVRPVAVAAFVWIVIVVALGPVVPMAYGDWLSGRAAQYDRAMQQRYAQLRQAGPNSVRLVPLSQYPASLFLEDVKEDSTHLWNRCWADYYHKKTIVLRNAPEPLAP